MVNRADRVPSPPLDESALERVALRYVERYASTRSKLAQYLRRKVRERGWNAQEGPAIDALVVKLADLGYVDDAAWATQRHAALNRRGFGERQVSARLRQAGIEATICDALRGDDDTAFRAAEAFARRRRIGPFAVVEGDDRTRRRAVAAMIRAGHDFALTRRFVDARPGEVPEWEG